MTLLPKVKLKAAVNFPASVLDGTGIDVTKSNGSYRFDLDFADFAPPVGSVTDAAHQNALLWNSVTGSYTLAPMALLSGGSLPDAPNNGTQYGRQSLGWTPIVIPAAIVPSATIPVMDGIATPGAAAAYSRGDHIHPTDTSRAPAVFIQAGTGAVNRTVQDKARDIVSVKDFAGVDATGATDSTVGIQAALTYAASSNLTLRIPAGKYLVSGPLTYQLSAATGGVNSQGLRASIIGDGSGDTLLFYTGVSAVPVLSVIGGDYNDLITVRGFRINRSFVTPAGVGFLLQKAIGFLLDDLSFSGFDIGYQLTDVNGGKLLKVRAQNNNNGFVTQQGGGGVTAPNLIEWDSCFFTSNVKKAGVSILATVQTFRNCTFEGNGDGSGATLTLTYDGSTGTAAASFYNNYFELNYGTADILLVLAAGMPNGNMVVDGNVFDRINATTFVINHIQVDASALGAVSNPFNMQVRGNGFFEGGSYVASVARPAILQAAGGSGYKGFRSNDMINDNTFSNPSVSGPALTTSALIGGEAICQISAAGVLSNGRGVTAVSKTGTGQYTLTVPQLNSAAAIVTATPNTTAVAQASGQISGATSVIVQTGNAAGSAADIATSVRIKML